MSEVKTLPKFLKSLFWEVNFEKLTLPKDATYIAARIMDKGSEKTWDWMFENITLNTIKKTLKSYRDFSLLSANFWALILGIPKNEIRCFQKPWITMRKRHWPR
ncbi:MAG: hypothetical protein ABH814_02925 [bacterium]